MSRKSYSGYDLGTNNLVINSSAPSSSGDLVNKNYADNMALYDQVNVVTTSGSSQTIPAVTTATLSIITLTASCTFTLPTPGAGVSFSIIAKQNGTGGFTLGWAVAVSGAIKWPGTGSTAPTMTTTANHSDIYSFVSDGANYWATYSQNYT